MRDFIISIRPRHTSAILVGAKLVEIRRKSSNLSPGDRLWIYSTRPEGQVVASAKVELVETDTKAIIWSKYGDLAAISEAEYNSYVGESTLVFVIKISAVEKLLRPISLEELRGSRDFHPPQYLCSLRAQDRILQLLENAQKSKEAA